jgi:beta-carotene 15,15'-dioxygenase
MATLPLWRDDRLPTLWLPVVLLAAIALNGLGILVASPSTIAVASLGLLIFGLPHGSFDLALLRRAGADGGSPGSIPAIVALYLGAAAAMYFAWRVHPTFALGVFLVLAMAHFAEDWEADDQRFFAGAIAAAIVAAPAVMHLAELRSLFVTLTGDPTAALLADMLLLVAPVAIGVAAVGIGHGWRSGERAAAGSAGCGLAAMLLLPPVIGFALFFCLVHSPFQFRRHADSLGLRGIGQWGGTIAPLSLGGLGIGALIFTEIRGVNFGADIFAASFIALSVLTVPHMLVPLVVGQVQRHRNRLPGSTAQSRLS